MGNQLVTNDQVRIVAWLDSDTADLLRATLSAIATRQIGLIAAVLYGSVARHEERPVTARHPSDVDVLLVYDMDEVPGYADRMPVFEALVRTMAVYPDAPREVQVMFATRTLAEWDETFVENVAREGILLWARGPLPAALVPVEQRARASTTM